MTDGKYKFAEGLWGPETYNPETGVYTFGDDSPEGPADDAFDNAQKGPKYKGPLRIVGAVLLAIAGVALGYAVSLIFSSF